MTDYLEGVPDQRKAAGCGGEGGNDRYAQVQQRVACLAPAHGQRRLGPIPALGFELLGC